MTRKGLVRVNTRIGVNHNDWLDAESERTGISKSALIQLSIDSYMNQKQALYSIEELSRKVDEIARMQQD